MDTHCPFGLHPIRPCTNWSFVQLDHLLIGHVHSPPKINWTRLAHSQSARLTPLNVTGGVYMKRLNLLCGSVARRLESFNRTRLKI